MRLTITLLFALLSAAAALAAAMSDAQVKQAIIQESLASHPGPCPCPYSIMRNGRQCGTRSAYSKPGGYSPICYESQITQAMIQTHRRQHGL
jgi:hypothetical protein